MLSAAAISSFLLMRFVTFFLLRRRKSVCEKGGGAGGGVVVVWTWGRKNLAGNQMTTPGQGVCCGVCAVWRCFVVWRVVVQVGHDCKVCGHSRLEGAIDRITVLGLPRTHIETAITLDAITPLRDTPPRRFFFFFRSRFRASAQAFALR